MNEKTLWSYCAKCLQQTKHASLYKKMVKEEDEYMSYGAHLFYVLECNGCEEISFRKDYHNYMNTYQDIEGKDKYTIESKVYPSQLENHQILQPLHILPKKVRNVYEQTILAFKGESKLLAGVGFRAVIEAICLEENIKGSNLEQKINNLAKNRLITEKEAERLHSIRFLGNDSVHEIEIPSDEKLYMVLDVVEHLLKNLYIIDINIYGLLDTIIKEYMQFEFLLLRCAREQYRPGDIKTLKEILGKHVRRVTGDLTLYEKAFIEKISNGEINWIVVEGKGTDDIKYRITENIVPSPIDDLPF